MIIRNSIMISVLILLLAGITHAADAPPVKLKLREAGAAPPSGVPDKPNTDPISSLSGSNII